MEFGGGHASRPSTTAPCFPPLFFPSLRAFLAGAARRSRTKWGGAKGTSPSGAATVPPPLALHAPLMPQMVA